METVAYVFTNIPFLDIHSPDFFKKCLEVAHWKSYLIMEELKHKVGLRVAEIIIIFEKHFN